MTRKSKTNHVSYCDNEMASHKPKLRKPSKTKTKAMVLSNYFRQSLENCSIILLFRFLFQEVAQDQSRLIFKSKIHNPLFFHGLSMKSIIIIWLIKLIVSEVIRTTSETSFWTHRNSIRTVWAHERRPSGPQTKTSPSPNSSGKGMNAKVTQAH